MKQVIGRKIYDTNTSTLVGQYNNGMPCDNVHHLYTVLYLSPNGQYFKHLQYWEDKLISHLRIVDDSDAFAFLESINDCMAMEKYFDDYLEKG